MTDRVKYIVVDGVAKAKDEECGTNPCTTPSSQSDNLAYVGPNLPCTGIRTCDSLTVALQKIDAQICALKTALYNLTTTTSTTTSIPT